MDVSYTTIVGLVMAYYMRRLFFNIVCIITSLGVIVFSFYIINQISTYKDSLYTKDSQIANLSIDNYELKETIEKIASFDIQENDSILRSCFTTQIRNTLILRLTEEVCMNCYYNSLQRALLAYQNGKQDFDFKVLGKYRFYANFENDIKDLVSSQIELINTSETFKLDELSAPYLLFFNKNGNLSHVYVLPKNGNMDFGELYTSFN